jgi:pyruvate formate lyase activating enzyme
MIRVWKIDYSAVHDGPGIRTSLYLKGCPLRCIWCSNPEGQASNPNLVFMQSRCVDCGLCVERCPTRAIELQKDFMTQKPKLQVNRTECNLCGECISVCSPKALEIWGRNYSISELLKIVEKNRFLYRKSGGGITLTGGEPLGQSESILEFLQQCHKRGIHTVLETSAFGDEGAFDRILREVDWLFIDLKHMDPEDHLRITGRRNDLILRNVRHASSLLKKRGRTLVIRMVVVPGINDGDNIYKTAEFVHSLSYVKGIEFLPYHRYGIAKYELLNRSYSLPDLEPPSDELMENCKKVLISFGLTGEDIKGINSNHIKV